MHASVNRLETAGSAFLLVASLFLAMMGIFHEGFTLAISFLIGSSSKPTWPLEPLEQGIRLRIRLLEGYPSLSGAWSGPSWRC